MCNCTPAWKPFVAMELGLEVLLESYKVFFNGHVGHFVHAKGDQF